MKKEKAQKEINKWEEELKEYFNYFPNGLILSAKTQNTFDKFIMPRIKSFISQDRQDLIKEILRDEKKLSIYDFEKKYNCKIGHTT